MSDTGNSNYSWALPYLPAAPRGIVEVGSRDAQDAVWLARHFGCAVVAFEPDPRNRANCDTLIGRLSAPVTIRPEALTNVAGPIEFWQANDEYGNPGVSSLFLVDFDNRGAHDPDTGSTPVQHRIIVQGARWDELRLPTPELLVMDVQGAEMKVLQGFGADLRQVAAVVAECAFVPAYSGGTRFAEMDRLLRASGFRCVATDRFGSGTLRLRIAQFRVRLFGLLTPGGKPRFAGEFNAVYRRRHERFARTDVAE